MNIFLKMIGFVAPELTEREVGIQYAKDNVVPGTCFYTVKDSEATRNGFGGYGEKVYDMIVLDTNDNGMMLQTYYFNDQGELRALTPSFYDWEIIGYAIRIKLKIIQTTPDYLKDQVETIKNKG